MAHWIVEGNQVILPRDTNQARGLAEVALEFLRGRWGSPDPETLQQLQRFHIDSLVCGISALAWGTNAPWVLRREAERYADHSGPKALLLGSSTAVAAEKAIAANCAAVREWDANGTNFGYRPERGHTAGEFGHNDFYPVVQAAAEQQGADGPRLLRAMLLLDEIRARLAEVFALRRYKLDHVLHGAVASAVVYGAMQGASVPQLESAVGMVVAHYVPYRAIRFGDQLSDSKGASAALSAEAAVTSVHRALLGFRGPGDIFRNPQAVFCLNEPPPKPRQSPFDLVLTVQGSDFAVREMHFKLGLYEHQSAGAIQGIVELLGRHPQLLQGGPEAFQQVQVRIYEPAYGIICDPAKRDPRTRQSADHSLYYIVARLLAKALRGAAPDWSGLMLLPEDYSQQALEDPLTRQLMQRVQVTHGGPEFDARYPEGIPTQVVIQHATAGRVESPLVMFPLGHARNQQGEFFRVLQTKWWRLLAGVVPSPESLLQRLESVGEAGPEQVRRLYDFPWQRVSFSGLSDQRNCPQ